MTDRERNREERLLDWHLDQLEAEERASFDAELRSDAALRLASERLARVLRPLDQAPAVLSPANLADRVLSHVHRTRQMEHSPGLPVGERAPRRFLPFPGGRAREWIAVAACILLLLTVSVPGVASLRERSRQAICGNNLADVFRGLSGYRQSCDENLPFSGRVTNAAWLPGGSGETFASNSRHIFLLPKLGFVTATRSFVCPSDATRQAMQPASISTRSDFAERGVSYDSWNLSGMSPIVRPRSAVPYLSDAGPFFVRARFDSSVDAERANSPVHRGRGQSILFLDGRVQWTTSPMCGEQRDHVWLIRNVRTYNGTETPERESDAHLIPGFAEQPTQP